MHKILIIIMTTVLCSCIAEDSKNSDSNNLNSRDLTSALTLSDLVDARMKNKAEMNGSTVLINDNLRSYFNTNDGCAINPLPPCTPERFSSEVGEPAYSSSGVGPCKGPGFELTSESAHEKLNIDLDEHTDFFMLSGDKTIKANFYATIEFVERKRWCSDHINYGLKITLKDGEETHLLNQYID